MVSAGSWFGSAMMVPAIILPRLPLARRAPTTPPGPFLTLLTPLVTLLAGLLVAALAGATESAHATPDKPAFADSQLAAQWQTLRARYAPPGPTGAPSDAAGAPPQSPQRSVVALRKAINDAWAAKNWAQAESLAVRLVRAAPGDVLSWILFSRAKKEMAQAVRANSYANRFDALAAAYGAYSMLPDGGDRAHTLLFLGDRYADTSRWRPAINALKAARAMLAQSDVAAAKRQVIVDNAATLERRLAPHRFRVLNTRVESDLAAPRICIDFSEQLARGGVALAPFFRVDGKVPDDVRIDGQQACLSGFEHGARAVIDVRAGLPSAVDEALSKSSRLTFYVRDRSPSVRLDARAYVLPRSGQSGLPVTHVNTSRVEIEVLRVNDRNLVSALVSGEMDRPLSGYSAEELRNSAGAAIWNGTLDVSAPLNETGTTAFPVTQAIGRLEAGVYVARARAAEARDEPWRQQATQWFIVSDIGIQAMTAPDGVHVFTRSLETAAALAGAKVRLVARNNEVLGEAESDAAGYVRFAPGLARGTGGLAPAMVSVARPGADFAFLDLTKPPFDLSDRGVAGRPAPGPLDAFVALDRGVYRPGETVHMTALLRDPTVRAVSGVALTAELVRPDGAIQTTRVLKDEGAGGRTWSVALSPAAMTGTWTAEIKASPKDEPLASARFLVEDFQPERLDVTLTPKVQRLARDGTPATLEVAADYLFGATATDLKVSADVVVRRAEAGDPAFPGFSFGLDDQFVVSQRAQVADAGRTNAQGRSEVAIALPDDLPETDRALEARLAVRVAEQGGRAVERTVVLPIAARGERIGIRQGFKKGALASGDTAQFDVIVAGETAASLPGETRPLNWQLFRLERRYQWYGEGGAWRYEPVTMTSLKAEGTLAAPRVGPQGATTQLATASIAAPVEAGRYRLEVASADDGATVSSVTFTAGWWADEGADTPELLDIGLDRSTYAPGEMAKLAFDAPADGSVVITVHAQGLVSRSTHEVTQGSTVLEVAMPTSGSSPAGGVAGGTAGVASDGPLQAPGGYVMASFFTPMEKKSRRMPARAIGVRWFKADDRARRLSVELDAPEAVGSNTNWALPVRVTGAEPGRTVHLTVSLVDVGILNLTRFEAPDPAAHYFGQRRMASEVRDLYGRLIAGMGLKSGRLRSGGDGIDGMSITGAPRAETPLALFSGMVDTDGDGRALIPFELPAFSGQVRLTAIAWSDAKIGGATRDVFVRDPVALLVSGPRFLTLGDKSRIAINIRNITGPAGTYALSLRDGAGRPAADDRALELAQEGAGAQAFVSLDVSAGERGMQRLEVVLEGPDGAVYERALTVPVHAPTPRLVLTTRQTLPADAGRFILDRNALAGFLPQTARVQVAGGLAARWDLAGALTQVVQYPYGCAEQTTSRALPLLYLSSLQGAAADRIAAGSSDAGVDAVAERLIARFDAGTVDEVVANAIRRLADLQAASGAFGLWSPYQSDLWLTGYATDFLLRARSLGHEVPERTITMALDRLQNHVSYAGDFNAGGEDIAYALYLLARAGRAPTGELRYYADTRAERFGSALAVAQIGAALAEVGDHDRASRVLGEALGRLGLGSGNGETGGAARGSGTQTASNVRRDFGSGLRDQAAMVTLIAELPATARRAMARVDGQLATLSEALGQSLAATPRRSTQENAWLLLATDRLMADGANQLSIDGVPVAQGRALVRFGGDEIVGAERIIGNTGARPLDIAVTVTGAGATPQPASAQGLRLQRRLYTPEGTPIAPAPGGDGALTLRQNTRLVVVVEATVEDGLAGRLLLEDRIPAGFVVENPRLLSAGGTDGLSWIGRSAPTSHTAFRNDRVAVAFNLWSGSAENRGALRAAYVVRAVTPGDYLQPAAHVEDMYRPDRFARTDTRRVRITAE